MNMANKEIFKKIKFGDLVFPMTLVIYFFLNLWIILASNAHALLNDFWFLKEISERTQWSDPSSLYDGFFPYLYPLLLKLVPDSLLLHTTAFLSLIAACLTIVFVYLSATYLVGPIWAIVAAWVIALQPQFFSYATVSSADALAALPVAAALWVLLREWRQENPRFGRALFLAGLLIGSGASLRYHTLLLVIIPLALGLSISGLRWRATLAVISGFLLGYLPQIVINASAGEMPWSTMQGFNMYRQAVGVDWNATDSLNPDLFASPLSVILNNPASFTMNYLTAFSNFAFPLVVVVTAAFLSRGSRWNAIMWSMAVGALAFSLTSSTAFSDRTLIVFMPIWAISAAWIFQQGSEKLTRLSNWKKDFRSRLSPLLQYCLISVLLLWGTIPWIQSDLASGIARTELEASRANYEASFLSSVNVSSMTEVFSNDFNFYTLEVPGFVPLHNGGIAAISQRGTTMAPAVEVSGIQPFLCDSFRRNIQATIWNPGNGSGTEPELNAVLSGQSENSQILARSIEGLVVSDIVFTSEPCGQ